MPYISAEALIGAALVVVLAVGYQYMPTSGSETAGGAKKNNKKKNKKKSKGGELSSVPVSEVESDAGKHVKKKDKRKAKGKSEAKVIKTAAGPTGTAHKVEEAKSESESPEPPSFAAAAGSNPTRPKTLAEKLVPKPRKTKVDDMLEPEDRPPQLARVMKIVPAGQASSSAQASASSIDTEPSFEDEGKPREDEWNVVKTKKKSVSIGMSSSSFGSSPSSAPGSTEGLTKVQRKNRKRYEAVKEAKAEAEADRLRRLAQYRKEQERLRIDEIYNKQQKAAKQGGKVLSGGQTATLSENGKLVWD